MPEKEELAAIVGDTNISDTPEAIESYSRDERYVKHQPRRCRNY